MNKLHQKCVKNLTITSIEWLNTRYILIKLTDPTSKLPFIRPGQFVEVLVEGNSNVFLRRPISIHFVDMENNELWLLVQVVGEGTRSLAQKRVGETLNLLFPLGNGFSSVQQLDETVLLVGGGVGIAPLLEYGKWLTQHQAHPVFLLGTRTAKDLVQLDEFKKYGHVYLTTEDGSAGEQGFVTHHSILQQQTFDRISVCGPKPMMQAVACYARKTNTPCEVSLENMMACGLGACLCCVEKTVRGNVCVCKEGPVFNINDLTWME